ncbi:unnamed protein product [Cyprideis torosa]|uniref:PD-(D/E)XK nuclease superfamily protein n=1 Tax=Cyprideis torosa TaxID=163714 RepID=A0A7R8WSX0_9CRUS|nr:unnamed protein product [Cyprideis torosa]CAG0909645.1 unnamed protein product [Cyprideis torosa]
MIPEYSALCGYTDDDIDSVFAPELEGLDRDQIREWYNGYHWRGEKVYNPFDVLQLFKNREFVQNKARQVENSTQLHHLLLANDFDGLKQLFHAFFASIPNSWYNHGSIQSYEGYYASVFYSYFASLGLDIAVEDMTNLGRIDMTLKFNEQVYIFEFKVIENAGDGAAMAQLHDKQYADKYRALNQPIYLLGVEFSKESRNVEVFEVEQVDNV